MDNIFDNSKWSNLPTDDNIHKELVSALGGDFFAIVDASFLLPLFSAWRYATKDKDSHTRATFLCAFNLALDRAVKRKQIKGQAQTKQVYSKRLRKIISVPVND